MDKPQMNPPPGERLLRFVGDTIRFTLRPAGVGQAPHHRWQAKLRTNLGRADLLREEIIKARFKGVPFAGASWRDIPMRWEDGEWTLTLPLTETGYFKAKAYAIDPQGYQVWPDGADFGLSVHPDQYRSANTIYCAFPRMFGPNKTAVSSVDVKLEARMKELDERDFTVIPPSGKLRDLTRELPHIFDTLGCRILHLLPVNPTPATFARMGRFGSPYACGELTAVDPALVEFDKRTTGIDQFCELAYATHLRGGKLFLDLVINHTGWDCALRENHPEWYLRNEKGEFASPGAWGVIWADLVELEHKHARLWEYLAEVFLTWCRRGVDGFRCDAGYKVPMPAWQYITARVREEFPDALFLLEGLGGGWDDTENLLTEGGLQWAYSELFQEFSGPEVANYLSHALKQSRRIGVLVHYSETHDNLRLASKGRAWSILRNRLSALTSVCGGFGFTNGVEWLADERIRVHGSTGMAWGRTENIIPELARLNQLVADHPCFFDGAKLTRLSTRESPVYALLRESEEGRDRVLVLVNNDAAKSSAVTVENPFSESGALAKSGVDALGLLDLLGQKLPVIRQGGDGRIEMMIGPAACFCVANSAKPLGLHGEDYRRARARSAWAMEVLGQCLPVDRIKVDDWRQLAEAVDASPAEFLASIHRWSVPRAGEGRGGDQDSGDLDETFPRVVSWHAEDQRRTGLVPPGHWLLVVDSAPFRAALEIGDGGRPRQIQSIAAKGGHIGCFFPRKQGGDATLRVERLAAGNQRITGSIRFLGTGPALNLSAIREPQSAIALLTNGIGGMARLCVDLGNITSKYDCLLGANLHSSVPADRHVFAKRVRVWVIADGFITPLNKDNLISFLPGPPAHWRFLANAGDGRTVEIELRAEMVDGKNTTILRFHRGPDAHRFHRSGRQGHPMAVSLTVRVDIEDRNFHWETRRDGSADYHFAVHTHPMEGRPGFEFTPALDRQLTVFADDGLYHHESEWIHGVAHPVEQSRGMTASGDTYSPGWFELPLMVGGEVTLVATAEPRETRLQIPPKARGHGTTLESADAFGQQLARAAEAFVVRRGSGKTVIAGYPWFLDWGRDTLICARGLLAAGKVGEVTQMLVTFGRFEADGTLPNTIHGEDASNRDTSDAPLWYGVVCEDLAGLGRGDAGIYETRVDESGRRVSDILRSIAIGYLRGTPNRIRVDRESALVWSPGHFTWMDTNYPAGTPREGYPVEIQALWIRLLRQLERINAEPDDEPWSGLAERAEKSLRKLYWLEGRGWLADQLIATPGVAAGSATPDDALRSNCLLAISLGLVTGDHARRCVDAAVRHLVVPGALRSLAPLPVSPPLPIRGLDGKLLNDPGRPYWGRYEGDEDTRRKPAYHNGTAWVWTFPIFCEALARAWEFSPEAVATARAYLGSLDRLLVERCVGQLPEIVDGDYPHTQRGCDAQAWSVTEALRVWKLLNSVTILTP